MYMVSVDLDHVEIWSKPYLEEADASDALDAIPILRICHDFEEFSKLDGRDHVLICGIVYIDDDDCNETESIARYALLISADGTGLIDHQIGGMGA